VHIARLGRRPRSGYSAGPTPQRQRGRHLQRASRHERDRLYPIGAGVEDQERVISPDVIDWNCLDDLVRCIACADNAVSNQHVSIAVRRETGLVGDQRNRCALLAC